jgi:hypothetical protein
LSTGGQAALVLVEELDEEVEELLEVDDVVDDEEPESEEELDVDDVESDFAETVPLPLELERLSLR